MSIEIKIPSVGESVTEALVARWYKAEGESIAQDEPIAELETDKVTIELPAPASGTLERIVVPAGASAAVGAVIATLQPGAPAAARPNAAAAPQPGTAPPPANASPPAAAAAPPFVMPAAQRVLGQHGVSTSAATGSGPGGRVLKEDAERAVAATTSAAAAAPAAAAPAARAPATRTPAAPGPVARGGEGERLEERVPMTPIRKRIAQRLVQAQATQALLTTFNEVDMSAVKRLRGELQEAFTSRHGAKLGFMSFFVKACVDALRRTPQLNAEIQDDHIVYRNYFDIGIAVSTERGLLVPVIRNVERLSFGEIEAAIADFGARARDGKIKLPELEGGTFTITNGGIFGSLLSTPIINPPQSGVLGLHAIQDRPVAHDGQVVIRPVMYVALTYDHRIVDGREAVTFLRRIKETIEDPARMLLEV